jgi:7-cyano-7-deazaguanine tRNA-ribosyltransferase
LQIVAGFGLKGIKPRVWDPESPYYLKDLKAVMISYADFHQMPYQRKKAMEQGLHEFLNVPKKVKFYLDNGAFSFIKKNQDVPVEEYLEFVTEAQPDWYPIPQDFIPTPKMTKKEQEKCFRRTMEMNLDHKADASIVPVIHISKFLQNYVEEFIKDKKLMKKSHIALGGIVPNLLRVPKAIPHQEVLDHVEHIRQSFPKQQLHVFGIGGTATLHIAALLKVDSVDSCGWRNRAARGMIQLPGTGERTVAELGNWNGRSLSSDEMKKLKKCGCPVCKANDHDIHALQINGMEGFCNRATHNLWVLLEETRLIKHHLKKGTYKNWYQKHLDNTLYRPLIEKLVNDLNIQ